MAHITERFAAAVGALVGDGSVKERLAQAYAVHLGDIADDELPPAQREPFGELRHAMTRVVPFGRESAVRASVQKMSAAEAAGHAGTIARLYGELATAFAERAEPLKVVAGGAKAAPPRFAGSRP